MKIKPMGRGFDHKKLLSPMMEGTIKNEMKLNSLFGFDVTTKQSVGAYALVKMLAVNTGAHSVFSDIPVEGIDFSREYVIHPNYSISILEKDENGNARIPGFKSMDKEVIVDFKATNIEKVEDDIKISLKSILQVTNSTPGAPEKIEISVSADNEFVLYGSDYYMMMTIVPSSMSVPIVKIIDITDIIMTIYSEELEMRLDEEEMDDILDDEDYIIFDHTDELDPEGAILEESIARASDQIWGSEWIFYEIGNYDSPCGSCENEAGDFYGVYDVIYNSYHAKFTSKVIDTQTNEVKNEFKNLPMAMYQYDFDNFMKYAEHEDLSRTVIPKYFYSNENGVTVEITPESKDPANYKMFYNGIEYYSNTYRPTGLPFGFSPFDESEKKAIGKLDKKSNDSIKCINIIDRLPEVAKTIDEVYELKDVFYAKSKVGAVKIAKDYSALFFSTYCADSVNFQSKVLMGLHDLKKDKRVFVCTIGMSNSVLSMNNETPQVNQQSSVFDYHIFTSSMIADGLELNVENILSLVLNEDNTGFVLRTINSVAEGKVTVEIRDKENKAKIAQKDSCYFNESKGVIYVRDMFGVPTPLQIG